MKTLPPSDLRLHGRQLILARTVWLLMAWLSVSVFLLALPARYAAQRTVCVQEPCGLMRLAPSGAQAVGELGFTVEQYAGLVLAADMAFTLPYWAIGAILFGFRSNHRIGLPLSAALFLVGGTLSAATDALAAAQPAWRLPIYLLRSFGLTMLLTLFYLFPTGHFVPAWSRWLPILYAAWSLAAVINPAVVGSSVWLLGVAAALVTGLGAQLYRYHRVSGPVQRRQTRWALFGFGVLAMGVAVAAALPALFPASISPPTEGASTRAGVIYRVVAPLPGLVLPLSLGIAIRFYHLLDIDVLIRRTLIYSALSAALAGIYFVSVVALQAVLGGLTGPGGSELVTVLSTLAIAALFVPLRRRIQAAIDRRFYRRKYDAAKTLAAFSTAVRDEVDLDRLANDIAAVVQLTMQPAQMSLWLRTPDRNSKLK